MTTTGTRWMDMPPPISFLSTPAGQIYWRWTLYLVYTTINKLPCHTSFLFGSALENDSWKWHNLWTRRTTCKIYQRCCLWRYLPSWPFAGRRLNNSRSAVAPSPSVCRLSSALFIFHLLIAFLLRLYSTDACYFTPAALDGLEPETKRHLILLSSSRRDANRLYGYHSKLRRRRRRRPFMSI